MGRGPSVCRDVERREIDRVRSNVDCDISCCVIIIFMSTPHCDLIRKTPKNKLLRISCI